MKKSGRILIVAELAREYGFKDVGGMLVYSGRVCLGSIWNENNWSNVSKRLFPRSYSLSGIPGFPFQLFFSQEQSSRNIFRYVRN